MQSTKALSPLRTLANDHTSVLLTPTPHGLYDGRSESSNPSRLALGWNSNGDSSHEEDVILDDQHLYTPQPGYTGWQKTSYSPPTVTVSFKGKGDTPSRNNTLSRDTAYEDADILKAQVALQQDEDGRQELQVMVDNKITRDRQEIESLKKDLEDQVQRNQTLCQDCDEYRYDLRDLQIKYNFYMENYIKVPTAVRRFYSATTELVDIVPGLEPERGVRGFLKRVIKGVRYERELWREGYGHYLQ